jgi:hypothetical protein
MGSPGQAELDPELLALQAPPQRQRIVTLTIMAAAVVATMALVFALRGDMLYALAPGQPAHLGDVQSIEPSRLVSNTFVKLEGLPSAARGVRFRRGVGATQRVFPLAGQSSVYVQVQDSGGESFVRSEFVGRLVTFDDLGGRYSELARVIQRDLHLPVTGESFLLLADEPPASYRWTWLVGLLGIAFVVLDGYFIIRWFKPAKGLLVGAKRP